MEDEKKVRKEVPRSKAGMAVDGMVNGFKHLPWKKIAIGGGIAIGTVLLGGAVYMVVKSKKSLPVDIADIAVPEPEVVQDVVVDPIEPCVATME